MWAVNWKGRVSRVLYFLVSFFCELFRDQWNSENHSWGRLDLFITEGLWFSVIEGLRRRSDRRLGSSPLCVLGIFGILTYRSLRFLGSWAVFFSELPTSLLFCEKKDTACILVVGMNSLCSGESDGIFPTAKRSKMLGGTILMDHSAV